MQQRDFLMKQAGVLRWHSWRIKPLWHRLWGRWLKKSQPAKNQILPKAPIQPEIPRYPPFAQGLPTTPIDAILSSQGVLIERLRSTLGLTSDEFNRWVLPVLSRYAAFVHLLPASAHHHHRGAGGLWHHSLEVAFAAAQASEEVMFSTDEAPQLRRELEPRWRLAACLAGLLHDAGKPLSDLTVTDQAGQHVWNPYFEDVIQWAAHHQIERYWIQWPTRQHKRHQVFAVLCANRLLPQETTTYLSAFGPQPIASLLESLTGQVSDQPLAKLVQQADQASVSRDLKRNGLGTTIEEYVLGVIRRFVHSGHWLVNRPNAKVWHLKQGVFLDWGHGFPDLLALIRQDQVPGVPQEVDRLADFLIERGVAQPSTIKDTQSTISRLARYWRVRLPISQAGDFPTKPWLLRLTAPEWIFTTGAPAPLDGQVLEGEIEEQEIEGQQNKKDVVQKASEVAARFAPPAEASKVQAPTLDALLNHYGVAVPLLRLAIDPVLAGHQPLGHIIDQLEGRIVLLYPEGARQLGEPTHIVTTLFEAGAIEPDLMSPDRKVRVIQGKKVLVFTDALSKAIASALEINQANTARPSVASLTEVTPMSNHKSASTEVSSFLAPTEPKPALNACLPGLLPSMNDQTLVLSSSQFTPEQAIQELIEMIRIGKGRWLIAPVLQENGQSITDAGCLEQLAKAYPAFSLPLLRLTLRNLETDRLRLEGGKLILHTRPNA